MNASKLAKPGQRYLLVAGCCFMCVALSGCASYFRRGQLSPDELNQQNQERQQSEQQRLYVPDSDFNR